MQLALAVDGHSMFYVQQKLGWFFDPRRLLEYATAQPGVELGSTFWYTGLKDATGDKSAGSAGGGAAKRGATSRAVVPE